MLHQLNVLSVLSFKQISCFLHSFEHIFEDEQNEDGSIKG